MLKKKRFFLFVLFCMTILSMTGVVAYARYVIEKNSSHYDSNIDFSVTNCAEIHNTEDLLDALSKGYANVRISEDVENPLIVNSDTVELSTDLVLDLNGHDIQRNNRSPLLLVNENVRIVVTDSSVTRKGTFYNPVGTVLKNQGGSITVFNGKFESGVRESEYVNQVGEHGLYNQSNLTDLTTINLKRNNGYYQVENVNLPIITPSVKTEYGQRVTNGNLYFPKNYFSSNKLVVDGNVIIGNDIYLYYSVDDGSTEKNMAASTFADFYYEYYVTKTPNSYAYYSTTPAEGKIKVTVYGYRDVLSYAEHEDNHIATIGMQSGTLYIYGGTYEQNFGVTGTYCVYATGGYMEIKNGIFEGKKHSTCVTCNYDSVSQREFLNILGGHYLAYTNDIIHVLNGNLNIANSDFTKDATSAGLDSLEDTNNCAISLEGGHLKAEGTQDNPISINLSGSGLIGIKTLLRRRNSEAKVSMKYVNITTSGENTKNNRGVYLFGGEVNIEDCVFTMNGENAFGIRSVSQYMLGDQLLVLTDDYLANVTLTKSKFILNGIGSRGVSLSAGTVNIGDVDVDDYNFFYIKEATNCYGIYSTVLNNSPKPVRVNANKIQIFMGQESDNSAQRTRPAKPDNDSIIASGIFCENPDSIIALGDFLFVSNSDYTDGIHLENGSVTYNTKKVGSPKTVILSGAQKLNYAVGEARFDRPMHNFTLDNINAGNPLQIKRQIDYYCKGIFVKGGVVELQDVFIAIFSENSSGIGTTGAEQLGPGIKINGNLDIKVQTIDDNLITCSAMWTRGQEGRVGYGGIHIGSNKHDTHVNIETDALGIMAMYGDIDIFSDVNITSTRTTSIFLNGGRLNLGSDYENTVNINCTIDPDYYWSWRIHDSGEQYYAAVYIDNGILHSDSTTTFNVTHNGLPNESYDTYDSISIKSFAVRVVSNINVDIGHEEITRIQKGTIINNCGGGLQVRGNTSKLILGDANLDTDDLQIITTGNQVSNNFTTIANSNANWAFKQNITGGHAVEVTGGTVDIYNGYFDAKQGNGIKVSNGLVNIYNGSFQGGDIYEGNGGGPVAGVAASYAFKIMGGGNVTIHNGNFNSDISSAAMIMGSPTNTAVAHIKKGSFSVKGQSAISIFDYTDATFGIQGQNDSLLVAKGLAAGFTVEHNNAFGNLSGTKTTVNIYSGYYMSTRDTKGSNAWTNGGYIENSTALVNVRGGIFGGTYPIDDTSDSLEFVDNYAYSGIRVRNYGTLKVYGGTFFGCQRAIYLSGLESTRANTVILGTVHDLDNYNQTYSISSSETIDSFAGNHKRIVVV